MAQIRIAVTNQKDLGPFDRLLGLSLLERALRRAKVKGVQTVFLKADSALTEDCRQVASDWNAQKEMRVELGETSEANASTQDLYEIEIRGVRHTIKSRQDLKEIEKKLFESRINTCDGAFLRHVNRRMSGWLTRFLVKTPVTPNQLTVFVIFLSLLSAWLVAQGEYVFVACGGVLFQIVSVLDCCDGEISRLKLAGSPLGAWMDTLSDRIGFLTFLIGAGWGIWRQGGADFILAMGSYSLGILVVATFLGYAASSLWRSRAPQAEKDLYLRFSHALRSRGGFLKPILIFSVFVTRREFLAFLFMILALLNALKGLFWMIAVGGSVASVVLGVLIAEIISKSNSAKEGFAQ